MSQFGAVLNGWSPLFFRFITVYVKYRDSPHPLLTPSLMSLFSEISSLVYHMHVFQFHYRFCLFKLSPIYSLLTNKVTVGKLQVNSLLFSKISCNVTVASIALFFREPHSFSCKNWLHLLNLFVIYFCLTLDVGHYNVIPVLLLLIIWALLWWLQFMFSSHCAFDGYPMCWIIVAA
jgi:hypothetical protein